MTKTDSMLKTNVAYFMVVFTLLYCAGITFALLWGCPIKEIVKDIILIILTYLISKSGTIIDYFFGTSESSGRKSKLLAQASPPAPKATCCHTHDEEKPGKEVAVG